MLGEAAGRHPEPPGPDVVGQFAEEHGGLDNLGAELVQVRAGLGAADEALRVAAAGHLAGDVDALGQPIRPPLPKNRELVLLQVDGAVDDPLIERLLREKDAVSHARALASPRPTGYTTAGWMGVLEAVARIVQLGGAPAHAERVAAMRARFEERTGAFAPEDAWFEERVRAFWCDAVTRTRFGRDVEAELRPEERAWLEPLERAHRGLFRAEGGILVDVWSGAELAVTVTDDVAHAELEAGVGQVFDARVVGWDGVREAPASQGVAPAEPGSGPPVSEGRAGGRIVIALLPGALFHPREATAAIEAVLAAARTRELATDAVLDALLRMERSLRSLARVKASYAYRPEALEPPHATPATRRPAKAPS